jgi:hypothetical protein
MRGLGAIVVAAALCATAAVAGPLTFAGDAPPCRQQWIDLVQLHAENGNPAGPVDELTERWDATDAVAREYRENATESDCGSVIADFASDWDALESFQYDLYRFDPRGDLRRAEHDRRHYIELFGRLPAYLRHAFKVVRRHTQGAVRDLRPALADAPDVDVTDKGAVREFLEAAHQTKRDSTHIQKMRRPYRQIGGASLDEE